MPVRGQATFADENLCAVILELNGGRDRYGFDDRKVHASRLQSAPAVSQLGHVLVAGCE